jgi:hypothetical protein
VTIVGITGHRELRHPVEVRRQLDAILAMVAPPLVGVTSLAAGADQLFAAAVVDAGGSLEVIVPSRGYVESLPDVARERFEHFEALASHVSLLDFDEVGSDAYLAAGLAMLERCDALIAVWDGEPSRGAGGTADIVRRAQDRGIPVRIVSGQRAG